MRTVRLIVDANAPQPEVIARAAEVLRAGGVVAFPTETVYGLGANALDADAVRRIFVAKGRPSNNPLIVHVTSSESARGLCTAWPDAAQRLAEAFWPGPLTLVLPKAACIPDLVTAGGPTVALRVPKHAVARALIEATGLPLAAPSANLSTRISAVRAEHVLRMLDGRIDMVLDGGQTPGGLESTVVDVSGPTPRLLRPGLVSAAELERILGRKPAAAATVGPTDDEALPSPGLMKKHYAPLVPVVLVDRPATAVVEQLLADGLNVGWLAMGDDHDQPRPKLVRVALPDEPRAYSERLYESLHEFERRGVDRIVVERPPPTAEWEAVHDRLRRAAAADDDGESP